jgi:electron transport complex protein RnfA
MGLFSIFIGAALVNNYVLSKFLGICPFLGVSKKVSTSLGMGVAVTFVMTLASIITYFVQSTILEGGLEYLQTIAFILVIASLVQFVEMFLKKSSPALYEALGVFLPLITTNCAVLGLAIINVTEGFENIIEVIINSLGAAAGFTIAIVLFAGIRERLELADVPTPLKGIPIALITAGLMSIAFLGFAGLTI